RDDGQLFSEQVFGGDGGELRSAGGPVRNGQPQGQRHHSPLEAVPRPAGEGARALARHPHQVHVLREASARDGRHRPANRLPASATGYHEGLAWSAGGVLGHFDHLLGDRGVDRRHEHLRRCHRIACHGRHHPRHEDPGQSPQLFRAPKRGQVSAPAGTLPACGHLRDTAAPAQADPAARSALRPRESPQGVPGGQVLGQLP
ncbi:unnamed protein product, partial [Ectocarpus sp. 12 AP-2014]